MTAPNPRQSPTVKREPSGGGSGWGANATPAPPDHRTTALDAAVSILRGGKPAADSKAVLAMAEEFYQFLKKGSRG